MDLTADYFSLFQLPRRFALEGAELDRRYRDVQARVHPDRFAAASEAEKRLSMQWATQANEAYRTLKKPLERAKYLLHLAGHDVQTDKNSAMPAEFLMEQMEWRDAVEEARAGRDHHELEQLLERLNADLASHYGELASLIDDAADWPKAAEAVRRLMFLERVLTEIEDALAALDE